ncbi:MAG: cyclic nucleotide-binding domain-containing protein [Vulcanimicrobiota bacterium]
MEPYNARTAAEKLGVSRATLLRWFREGRITPVERDWRGWRVFTERDLDRIRAELGQSVSLDSSKINPKMRSYLANVPAFSRLPPEVLNDLAACARFQGLRRGTVFFSPGERSTGLYLLVKGRIRVFRMSPEGREQVLALVEPFETLGEAALFKQGGKHSSYALCEVSSTVLSLPLHRVQSLTRSHPQLALAFLVEFATRIESLEQRLEETALHSLERRIATYLLHQKKVDGRVSLPSVTALASLFGVVRESISRIFNRFEEQGWIKREGKEICILEPERLANV